MEVKGCFIDIANRMRPERSQDGDQPRVQAILMRTVLVLIPIRVFPDYKGYFIDHNQLLRFFVVNVRNSKVGRLSVTTFPLEIVLKLPWEAFK